MKERISEINNREPDQARDYYFFTILCKSNGNFEWYCYSHWVGYADEERRIELREASIVKADNVCAQLRKKGESCAVVNDPGDMTIFFLIGGNALIQKDVAESRIKDWLAPHPVAQSGALGFVCTSSLPKGAFNRAPTPKIRMEVIKRDGYRCKICGRRAADYVDVELHAHHIRPWADGGLSEGDNLITLCHTCHKGLAPHFERSLFELIESNGFPPIREKMVSDYWKGVQRYRKKMMEEFDKNNT